MQEKYNIDDFNANLGICMWKHEKEEVEFIKSEEEMLQWEVLYEPQCKAKYGALIFMTHHQQPPLWNHTKHTLSSKMKSMNATEYFKLEIC